MDNEVSAYLAKNIIELRKKRNWSQKDLSDYAKIPRSTITYIESGTGNPTLQVLVSIASALHVGVDELLSQPRSATRLYKPEDFKVQKRSKGNANITKLLPDRIQGIEIDRINMNASAVFEGQPHLQGTKEYLYVIAGEITVSVDNVSFTVTAGHLLAFQGDQPHTYRATSQEGGEAVSVVIPVSKFLSANLSATNVTSVTANTTDSQGDEKSG